METTQPDHCSSLRCNDFGSYCKKCSHASYDGAGKDSNGKMWRWRFSPHLGPLFERKDGEPLKRQPSEKSPAWDVFEAWNKLRAGEG